MNEEFMDYNILTLLMIVYKKNDHSKALYTVSIYKSSFFEETLIKSPYR